jgi:hypothetical protein
MSAAGNIRKPLDDRGEAFPDSRCPEGLCRLRIAFLGSYTWKNL